MDREQKEARPRYQRQPRPVHYRTSPSIPQTTCELLGAFLALACVIAVVWGFGFAYQMGYDASEHYRAQEVSSRA